METTPSIVSHQKDLEYLNSLVAIAYKSGAYPNMRPEVMLNIMMTAKDLGISPMKALNGGFYVVNGKIVMQTSMMVDRIRKDGHSIKLVEMSRDKCVLIGVRKDNGDSAKIEFTMEDAQIAGLTNSPTWKKYPKHMLYNRCMSFLARVLFPDVVGNAYSEDERYDIQNVPPEKRPDLDQDCIPCHNGLIEDHSDQMDKIDHQTTSKLEALKLILVDREIGIAQVYDFITERAIATKKMIKNVIDAAMMSASMTERFVSAYILWLAQPTTPLVHMTAEVAPSSPAETQAG